MASLTNNPRGRVIILVTLMLITAALIGPLAYAWHGWEGVTSAAVAMGVCLASGLLAMWLAELFRHPDQAVPQVLLGMFPRMGIPLIACMLVYLQRGMLADAGFVYYIMAFYFVTLAVETVLMAGRSTNKPTETQAG